MKPQIEQLQSECPKVSREFIENHITRLNDTYFETFTHYEIAEHITALHSISSEKPVVCLFSFNEQNSKAVCTVLSFDYPSLFSLITGVLAGLGFNIESGDVFTYTAPPPEANLTRNWRNHKQTTESKNLRRRKIIDRFVGTIADDISLSEWQMEFFSKISKVLSFLEEGSHLLTTARKMVNEMVADRLES